MLRPAPPFHIAAELLLMVKAGCNSPEGKAMSGRGVFRKRRWMHRGGGDGAWEGEKLCHESQWNVKLSKHTFLFLNKVNTVEIQRQRGLKKIPQSSEVRKWDQMSDEQDIQALSSCIVRVSFLNVFHYPACLWNPSSWQSTSVTCLTQLSP